MSKLLIIDCQVFQGPSYNRGVGRYSIELLKTLKIGDNLSSFDKYVLIFNKNLDINEKKRTQIEEIFKGVDFKSYFLNLPLPRDANQTKIHLDQIQNGLKIWVESLFGSYDSSFLILANFEGSYSISAFPDTKCKKYIIAYDLIPHIFQTQYITSDGLGDEYYLRYRNFYTADKIFTISKAVRDDVIEYLSIPKERVVPILGGNIPLTPKHDELQEFKVDGEFVLFPSGNDIRKNNGNSVEAFSKFVKKTNSNLTLVITSNFTDEVKNLLLDLRDKVNKEAKIIFTDYITDSALIYLYKNAKFVIFASEYEGLGLPVLEAIDYDKLVMVSDIPVFREMSSKAFYYVDPKNVSSIISGLEKINVATPEEVHSKQTLYKDILKEYSWAATGKRFITSVNTVDQHKASKERKPKIAMVGPGPYSYSTITKYLEVLIPTLRNEYEIDYVTDHGENEHKHRFSPLVGYKSVYSVDEFNEEKYNSYDLVFYHVGNSIFHMKTILKANQFPGVLVLHDFYLKDIFWYANHIGVFNPEKLVLEKQLEQLLDTGDKKEKDFSSNISLINNSKAVIAHSQYTVDNVKKCLVKDIPVYKISIPIREIFSISSDNIGGKSDKIKIGMGGVLGESKNLMKVLDIISKIDRERIEIELFGFDENDRYRKEYSDRLKKMGVKLTTNLSDKQFKEKLEYIDVLLNFRENYRGEASYMTLEALRLGKMVVVKDNGWYSNLKTKGVIKINDVSEIAGVINDLLSNPVADDKRKQEIKKYVDDNFGAAKCRSEIVEIINYLSNSSN